jgi:hypothetical protein
VDGSKELLLELVDPSKVVADGGRAELEVIAPFSQLSSLEGWARYNILYNLVVRPVYLVVPRVRKEQIPNLVLTSIVIEPRLLDSR